MCIWIEGATCGSDKAENWPNHLIYLLDTHEDYIQALCVKMGHYD